MLAQASKNYGIEIDFSSRGAFLATFALRANERTCTRGPLMTKLTIFEAQKALLDLPEKPARTPDRAVTITRRGRPVLAILPWEFYESIVETLEVFGDPEIVAGLRESLEDLQRGRVISHAEAKKRLGG
jgi:prevent-host-death family protein